MIEEHLKEDLINGTGVKVSTSNLMRQIRESTYARYREDAISNEIATLLLGEMQETSASPFVGLDIGSGNGAMTRRIEKDTNGGARIQGIDLCSHHYSSVTGASTYDGTFLPYNDRSFDFALLIDVLHHTAEPRMLLLEASRVARRFVIVKDHTYRHCHEFMVLSFMDFVGNLGYGNNHLGSYKKQGEWHELFQSCGLVAEKMTRELRIYPFPFSIVIRPDLNFVTLLRPAHDQTINDQS